MIKSTISWNDIYCVCLTCKNCVINLISNILFSFIFLNKNVPISIAGNLYKDKGNLYSAKLLPVAPNALHQD